MRRGAESGVEGVPVLRRDEVASPPKRIMFGQLDPLVLMLPLGTFYMGWVLGTGSLLPADVRFIPAILSIFPFLAVGTVLVNDAYDADVDAQSRRKKGLDLSTGRLGSGKVLAVSVAAFAASLVLAGFVSLKFFIVVGALTILAIAYSSPPMRLSRRAGLDLLANAVGLGSLCIIAGWVASGASSIPPPVWLFTVAFGAGAFFLFPALMDLESDEAGGKRGTAVVLGWKGSCALGTMLMGLANAGIVYMCVHSIILYPRFLLLAWPIIVLEMVVFPLLSKEKRRLKPMMLAMAALLSLGNVLILLSFTGYLGRI